VAVAQLTIRRTLMINPQSLRWFRTLMIYNPVRNKYIGSLKHLKSLYTFTDKSLQPVLAGFEQQFIPAVAKASAVVVNTK